MKKINRVILIVLDSVGIGETPDAVLFGDVGSHTLGNTARAVGGLDLAPYQCNVAVHVVFCVGTHWCFGFPCPHLVDPQHPRNEPS